MALRQGMMRGTVLLLLALLAALPAAAGTLEQELTRQLRLQGYGQIQISRTWLGRLRLQARSGDLLREIVVNPNTGEILRDYAYHQPQPRGGEGSGKAAETDEPPNIGTAGDGMGGDTVDVPDIIDPKEITGGKGQAGQGRLRQ